MATDRRKDRFEGAPVDSRHARALPRCLSRARHARRKGADRSGPVSAHPQLDRRRGEPEEQSRARRRDRRGTRPRGTRRAPRPRPRPRGRAHGQPRPQVPAPVAGTAPSQHERTGDPRRTAAPRPADRRRTARPGEPHASARVARGRRQPARCDAESRAGGSSRNSRRFRAPARTDGGNCSARTFIRSTSGAPPRSPRPRSRRDARAKTSNASRRLEQRLAELAAKIEAIERAIGPI